MCSETQMWKSLPPFSANRTVFWAGDRAEIALHCTYQVIIVSYFVNIWTLGGNNNIQEFSHEHGLVVFSPSNINVTLAER